MIKRISIFGSTGSIGSTVFRILDKNFKDFKIYTLAANSNYKKIEKQIMTYKPEVFIIFNWKTYLKIKKKYLKKKIIILNSKNYLTFKFKKSDISISAIPGISGLKPTLHLVDISKKILLANKEAVICGWNILKKKAANKKVDLIPIDSEHFSILNLIKHSKLEEIEKVYLTASGGPFLNYPLSKMKKIKPKDAVSHPKWKMGKKISVDSATLMNKIFEVIEANKLFNINFNKIEIIIHPQSLVHAIVKYKNGLYKFLYFQPDMAIPIGIALKGKNFSYKKYFIEKNIINSKLDMIKVDKNKFPSIKLKPILNKYVSLPIILNAANEIFVDQFLKKNIGFFSIINNLFRLLKDQKLRKYAIKKPLDLKTILLIDNWTRNKAKMIVDKNR